MSKTSDGAKLQPQFASSGNTPTFAADMTLLSDFYAARAFQQFATAASLIAATAGRSADDVAVATNTPGAWWRFNGSTWDMNGIARFADSSARSTALTAPKHGWFSMIGGVVYEYSEAYHATNFPNGYKSAGWYSTRRPPVLRVIDQKAVNTAGGTFTASAWQKRDLNTTPVDEIGGASVSSSVVTLPPGTYHVRASAPAFAVNANLLRLRQTSGTAATLVVGTAVAADSSVSQGVTTLATLEGEFTLSASQTLELQHYCATTRATNGLGLATNWGEANIFAEIQFEKVG